ncbi:aldehyde dehydrogenase family protein [Allokutzneria sp. NRRL B-24872]|uniref:aldehyde dehydrogenase family protein n=1 Tax=Allokutzneria sp. NRRL B-24872 TaxID=1137961 RepID=UPI001178C786|nr:aldehyde dehydrogenase family protein [Allokutzneria sp. NRRL B-24872]
MREHFAYVQGMWTRLEERAGIAVVNPTDERVIGVAAAGSANDVTRAVRAASRAFREWAGLPVAERAEFLRAIADGLQDRIDEIAALITAEVGTPLAISQRIQAGLPIASFRAAADLVGEVEWSAELGNSLVLKEPLGVVGAITPWNYPLHQVAAKVSAALAAGCTVVVKPSELAPFSALLLAEVADEVGLPPGVLNVVPGDGITGEALVAHELVDVVSFTGSPATGRRIGELAARAPKPVLLELGGKSASVLLDGLSEETEQAALADAVKSCLLNSGQTCTALTRLVVPRDRLDAALSTVGDLMDQYPAGDPTEPTTKLGPLVSQRQYDSVIAHIESAIDSGAKLAHGGPVRYPELPRGYFVRPTVLVAGSSADPIAREEVFGPVLTVLAHDGEDDAVRIANDSEYGLSGAVWSEDRDRAIAVARRIRAGQIDICGGKFNPLAPFGGVKRSGFGRELGSYGIEEFLHTKSLQC